MTIQINNILSQQGKVYSYPDIISGTITINVPIHAEFSNETLIVNVSLQGHSEGKKFFHVNFHCVPVHLDADGSDTVHWWVQVPSKIQKDSSFKVYSTLLEAMQRYSEHKIQPTGSGYSSRSSSVSSTFSASSTTSFHSYDIKSKEDNVELCEVHQDLPPSTGETILYGIITELYSYDSGRYVTRLVNSVTIRNDNHCISPVINYNGEDPWYYYKTNEEYHGKVAYKLVDGNGVITVPVPDIIKQQVFEVVIHSKNGDIPKKPLLRVYQQNSHDCPIGDVVLEGNLAQTWNLHIMDSHRYECDEGVEQHLFLKLPPHMGPTFHHCMRSRTYSVVLEFSKHFGSTMQLEVPVTIGTMIKPAAGRPVQKYNLAASKSTIKTKIAA